MRRIDVIHESFFENAGDGPAVVVRLQDWRKIRRVLRAAEVIRQRGAPGKGWDELRDAIDALNEEPKR